MAVLSQKLRWIRLSTAVVGLLGILVSCYAYYIETKKEVEKDYVAMCDISEHMSCSKAFMSKYGKGFGLVETVLGKKSKLNQPNSVYGIIFYSIFILLGQWSSISAAKLQLVLAILSNLGSVYLAYILYFILYDFCVVCVTSYVLNAMLLILALLRISALKMANKKPTQKMQ